MEDSIIDISGLDKAEVLAALYNNAKPQGLGYLHYDPVEITTEEAGELLKESANFDYLKGRVMKVSVDTDRLKTRCYDRDNGVGAAKAALAHLLEKAA